MKTRSFILSLKKTAENILCGHDSKILLNTFQTFFFEHSKKSLE